MDVDEIAKTLEERNTSPKNLELAAKIACITEAGVGGGSFQGAIMVVAKRHRDCLDIIAMGNGSGRLAERARRRCIENLIDAEEKLRHRAENLVMRHGLESVWQRYLDEDEVAHVQEQTTEEEGTLAAATNFCPNCGQPVADPSPNFCRSCGTQLSLSEAHDESGEREAQSSHDTDSEELSVGERWMADHEAQTQLELDAPDFPDETALSLAKWKAQSLGINDALLGGGEPTHAPAETAHPLVRKAYAEGFKEGKKQRR